MISVQSVYKLVNVCILPYPCEHRHERQACKHSCCICRLYAKDYIGKWVLLFFYPKDFTFVCPTEIIAFSDAAAAFAEKNCAVIGASTDSAEVHLAWINTPRKKGGLGQMKIPLIADVTRRISKAYGVLGAGNFPYRGIFLMDPQVCI
jgi:alkyl hydroperoxide reductase subunit AhpC